MQKIIRAWKNSEVTKAYRHEKVMHRQDIIWAMSYSRTLGLRIEKITALTKTLLREAFINDYLHLTKTKGGIVRDVPLNNRAEQILKEMLAHGKGDERIFMTHGCTYKQAIKSIQNWVYNHCEMFTDQWSFKTDTDH